MIAKTCKTLEEAKVLWPEIPVGRAKDLTNQKFKKLTVLYRTISKPNSQAKWVCQCECGNYVSVFTSNLTKEDHTYSCGCYGKEQAYLNNRHNLIGQSFGFLTVLEDSGERSKQHHIIWKCKCNNCGSICYVNGTHLLGEYTRSCGCIKSFGEATIKQILNNKEINYKTEYWFKDLKLKQYLKFDFGLLDNNSKLLALLEFQGRQHYDKGHARWFGELERTITDPMKKEYCKNNNIKLYEIKYNDNIEEKINQILKEIYGEKNNI